MSILEEFKTYSTTFKTVALVTVISILTMFIACVLNVYTVISSDFAMVIIAASVIVSMFTLSVGLIVENNLFR